MVLFLISTLGRRRQSKPSSQG